MVTVRSNAHALCGLCALFRNAMRNEITMKTNTEQCHKKPNPKCKCWIDGWQTRDCEQQYEIDKARDDVIDEIEKDFGEHKNTRYFQKLRLKKEFRVA